MSCKMKTNNPKYKLKTGVIRIQNKFTLHIVATPKRRLIHVKNENGITLAIYKSSLVNYKVNYYQYNLSSDLNILNSFLTGNIK